MKHGAATAAWAAVALTQVACDGGGLVAFIQLEPGVQASCVSLTVTEPDTGGRLDGRQLARVPGQDEYKIAVYRGKTLPGEVVFQAHALSGSNGCAVPVTLVSSSESQRRAFPAFPPLAGGHLDQVPLVIPFLPVVPSLTIDFSTPALMGLGGACLGPVRVLTEDQAGNPAPPVADTSVALSADASGVTFFSDAQCQSAVTGTVLGPGAPEATFYFRSRAAGTVTLRAEAPALAAGTQAQQIVPNVRAGSCTVNVGTLSQPCQIGAPGVFDPSRAFLVVQAISDDNNPAGVNVRCNLADAGTIDCTRYGGGGTVNVAWQLVELASGLHVQRVGISGCPGATLIPLPQAVNPAQTFVLFTAQGPGGVVDDNDYRMVHLVGNGSLEVLNNSGCGNADLDVQVVEWQGAVVERGVADAGFVPSVTVTTATSADPSRSFLLHSARFIGYSALCGYQIRGRLEGPNAITFSRGAGNDAVCQTPDINAIAWERVTLPPGGTSQQVPISMADGQTFATAAIAPVDPARAFTFSSSQFNAGAGFGETSYNGEDSPGAAGATHRLAAGNRLELNRSVDAGVAWFTSYVVELP